VHVEVAQRLAGPALEQHVVRQDHCRAAVDVEDRGDALHEVELLGTAGTVRTERAETGSSPVTGADILGG
jgi:hypothetical protein